MVTPSSFSPSFCMTRSTGWLRKASISAFFCWYWAASWPLSSSAVRWAAARAAWPLAIVSIL